MAASTYHNRLESPKEPEEVLPTLGDFSEVRHVLAGFAKKRLEDTWAYMHDRLPIEKVSERAKADSDALNAVFLGRVEHPGMVALPSWNRPDGLGAALVAALGMECAPAEAVGEAASLMARDVVKLYAELDADKWDDGITALIEGYTWLMVGKRAAVS